MYSCPCRVFYGLGATVRRRARGSVLFASGFAHHGRSINLNHGEPSAPEVGFEEMASQLLEARFWTYTMATFQYLLNWTNPISDYFASAAGRIDC
jgi:hypothetical protein